MFIGFYDYTVVLTYMSLLSSIVGMTEALDGRFGNAIACLVVSGICDMLDGKVARTKKDRTEDQKNFGIQIDSLCDLFCFGAFPAFLTYALGVRHCGNDLHVRLCAGSSDPSGLLQCKRDETSAGDRRAEKEL